MPPSTLTAEINTKLAQTKQLYEAYWGLLIDPRNSIDDPKDEGRRRLALTAGALLLKYITALDSALLNSTLNAQPVNVSANLRDFFTTEVLPHRERLEKIVGRLWEALEPGTRLLPSEMRESNTPAWNIFATGVDWWSSNNDGEYSEAEVARTETLFDSPFFNPDDWIRNADDIRPITGDKAGQRIPGKIRNRFKEVIYSYVLGNYLAAIALCRAILEYTLIDRASAIGFEWRDAKDASGKRAKRLSWLVQDAAEKHPSLKSDMETVVEAGNRVLHPHRKEDVVELLPTSLRPTSLSSIRAMQRVIESLYF